MEKFKLYLEGLDCAGCAVKIEDKINKLSEVNEATLNFTTKTLTIESKKVDSKANIIIKTKEIINKLEPHVVVIEEGESREQQKPSCRCECCHSDESKKPVQGTRFDHHEHAHDNEDHHHEHHQELDKKKVVKFGIAVILYSIGLIFRLSFYTELFIFLLSYILVGGEIVLSAARNIARGNVFDENFLMSIATMGAFAIRQFPEAVAVMIFYQVGEMFQDMAVNKSRKSIGQLMDIRPEYATIKKDDGEISVSPEEVRINDLIVVKAGEKVPLDGIIISGEAALDTSALTGESLPREVGAGDEVLSGSINKNGLLIIKVTKIFKESTVAKILDLVQNAGNKKAYTEKFITKFAKYYTPIVVFFALALAFLPPLVMDNASFSQWIYRALVFLVVSCPCALVVSIPLTFFGGIGAASKHGILVKGGNYLEALNKVEAVIFDKTGTLTKGTFKVLSINPNENLTKKELLRYAAYAESYSNHPIAVSIVNEFGEEIDKEVISSFQEVSGQGIKVNVREKEILAGNYRLMMAHGIPCNDHNEIGTIVHIAIDRKYSGYIVISDEIKDDSKLAIEQLSKQGVKKIAMLTGDDGKVAKFVGDSLGITHIYAQLLPPDKVDKLEEFLRNKSEKGKVIFVGDGINDAPVLARADIGIAMGGVGSDAAIEAADVVIMTDELSKIPLAIELSKKTNIIVWQNIIFALGIKLIILVLGALGIANMWEAVFGDVGVALLAVLNSMRILKIDN